MVVREKGSESDGYNKPRVTGALVPDVCVPHSFGEVPSREPPVKYTSMGI